MTKTVSWLSLLSAFVLATASGCAIPDISIRHPLIAGRVDPNRVLKTKDMDESSRGLARGVLSDEAQLLELNNERACVGVRLTDLQSIDLATSSSAKLRTSGMNEIKNPQSWPDQPTVVNQPGLVPQRYYAGVQTYCSYYGRYGCLAYSTRPYYLTRMVPGTIAVFTTSGRLCFSHGGTITTKTKWVQLDVTVDRLGGGSFPKNQQFTWELAGAQ